MAAAMAGGKGKKKKWSKGKARDKVDNKVLMSKEQHDRLVFGSTKDEAHYCIDCSGKA